MPGRDIIAIGASAGGVEALNTVARSFPSSLEAAVFVVLHIPAQSPGLLPAILCRSGPLEAVHAEDGMKIRHGRIYIAPPDHHMLVEKGKVRVVRGPKENRHRPAISNFGMTHVALQEPCACGTCLETMMAGVVRLQRTTPAIIVSRRGSQASRHELKGDF